VRLVDAARCPYCARVRIALAEKGLEVDTVEVDLRDRPEWLYELNPPDGRVPVLDDGFILPESEVIMAYLDERHPDPPLLPADALQRARTRLLVHRFDANLGDDYYAFRRGDDNDLAGALDRLELGVSLFADVAYVPWVIRARDLLGVSLPARVGEWLDDLVRRPSVAAEVDVVRGLT
jgi:stringent starvation protein A